MDNCEWGAGGSFALQLESAATFGIFPQARAVIFYHFSMGMGPSVEGPTQRSVPREKWIQTQRCRSCLGQVSRTKNMPFNKVLEASGARDAS